ncbi:hypothetical protein QFC24_006202 [Naganishia onofrii]|uniref:Uncharacterized protein n=1 Tax=Naganishia onofrii TaxID=1851511 RepID=A0ACC2X2W9_9TREE|nr:hypothetical protein QFC24_006202 [Naganishia onofrii]
MEWQWMQDMEEDPGSYLGAAGLTVRYREHYGHEPVDVRKGRKQTKQQLTGYKHAFMSQGKRRHLSNFRIQPPPTSSTQSLVMVAISLAVLLACLPYFTQATNGNGSQIYEFPLKATNVLATVPPSSVFNYTSIFLPESVSLAAAKTTPFHVYHPDFHAIVGPNPRLTVVWSNDEYAAAHEAPVYHQRSNALFFAANAGAPLGRSGLDQSNVVWRMDIGEATSLVANAKLNAEGDYVGGNVTLEAVPNTDHQLENVNGGTNYRGQLVFMTEGRGDSFPSGITVVNPVKPYNATVILNNFFGRQFSSLNDVAYHRKSGDLFFTDPTYGFVSLLYNIIRRKVA